MRSLPQTQQIFLLSPARCDGKRAQLVFNPHASFPLAHALRQPAGVSLGEAFSFLSGLYFRGKLAYAQHFARPPRRMTGIFIITAERGLLPPDQRVGLHDLRAFADVPLNPEDPRYHGPLGRDVQHLADALKTDTQVVFLGSIATGKYLDLLLEPLGDRLIVPSEFIGRGDMSRGGLLLRSVREERELNYIPAAQVHTPRGRKPSRRPSSHGQDPPI